LRFLFSSSYEFSYLFYLRVLRSTNILFATTQVITKQETIDRDVTKFFPMKLLHCALDIFAASRNAKLAKKTDKIFMHINAKMLLCVRIAKIGLTSIAAFPIRPITVVNKSISPKRTKAEQARVRILIK
jgi:hypothetical protein